MATLATIRAALNGELGVISDAETAPWTQAVRNQAISDGYAALWRHGVWRLVSQDVSTIDDSSTYALTSIRRLRRLELIDSSVIVALPRGVVQDDGAGAFALRLVTPIDAGYTLRVSGYAPYISTFANDAAVDDLPAEHARIPRLKAKAICYRIAVGQFARVQERRNAPPVMNATLEQLIGLVAETEREFEAEAKLLSSLRPRTSQVRRL